jgi:hypothetical protein
MASTLVRQYCGDPTVLFKPGMVAIQSAALSSTIQTKLTSSMLLLKLPVPGVPLGNGNSMFVSGQKATTMARNALIMAAPLPCSFAPLLDLPNGRPKVARTASASHRLAPLQGALRSWQCSEHQKANTEAGPRAKTVGSG